MTRDPARCGTVSGYNRHRNLGEQPCADCQAANAARSRRNYQYWSELARQARERLDRERDASHD